MDLWPRETRIRQSVAKHWRMFPCSVLSPALGRRLYSSWLSQDKLSVISSALRSILDAEDISTADSVREHHGHDESYHRGTHDLLGRWFKKLRPSEANDASFSNFFIFHFFSNIFIFSLSSSLLPSHPSFFLVQHCLYHLESVKGHFSAILTKALPTDGRTDGPTDGRTDGQGLL